MSQTTTDRKLTTKKKKTVQQHEKIDVVGTATQFIAGALKQFLYRKTSFFLYIQESFHQSTLCLQQTHTQHLKRVATAEGTKGPFNLHSVLYPQVILPIPKGEQQLSTGLHY